MRIPAIYPFRDHAADGGLRKRSAFGLLVSLKTDAIVGAFLWMPPAIATPRLIACLMIPRA